MFNFDKLAIFILGLESGIWDSIGKGEKYLYKSLTIAFSIFAFLSVLSGCFLIYLITSKPIISMVFGLMVAYVVTSIVRFSLVILRKSVFPETPKKTIVTPPLNVVKDTSATFMANRRETESMPIMEDKKTSKFLHKIKSVFSAFSLRTFFPDMGIIIRIVVLSMMCLLVVFPLSSLIYLRSINSICENERQVLLTVFKQQNMEFMQSQMKSYESRIVVFNQQINELRKGGIDGNVFGRSIKAQRDKLVNEMQEFKAKQEDKISSDYAAYNNKISNRYFVVKCFTKVKSFYLFPFVFSLVFFLLLYPHILLVILKKGKAFQYATKSTSHYRSIVEENYIEKQSYLDSLLKNKYPEIYPSLHMVRLHTDPPFCSIKNEFFPKRKSLTKAEFEASFNV